MPLLRTELGVLAEAWSSRVPERFDLSAPYYRHGMDVGLTQAAVDRPSIDGPGRGVPSDEDLVEDFYAGEDTAIECLIRRYRWLTPSVFARLPLPLGDRAAKAEEIVQTAWIKVLDTRTTGRNRWLRERGLVRPWLWVIVSNCLRDEVRRPRLRGVSLDAILEIADRNQGEVFHQCELDAMVAPLLESLTRRQRAVVSLKFWVGMPQCEIAAVLGVSEATVSRDLDGALQTLRPLLLGALSGDDER